MTIKDLYEWAAENDMLDKEIVVVHPLAWDQLGCGDQHFVKINKEPIYVETIPEENVKNLTEA